MKFKNIIIVIILLFSTISIYAETFADKYMDRKGATVIYISKAMIKMFPNIDTGIDINSVTPRLESIVVITSEKNEIKEEMKKDIAKIKKDKSYEILMKIREDNSKVDIYAKMISEEKISEILMVVDESNECVIIQLCGNLTTKDLESLSMSNQ